MQQSVIACSEAFLLSLLHDHFTARIKTWEKQGWDAHPKGIAVPDCIRNATEEANAALEVIELFRKEGLKEGGGKKEHAPRMKKTKTSKKRRYEEDSDYCEWHVSGTKQTTGITPPAPSTSF